ncbi:hypothetical protein SAMN05519104_3434 [Rhizobiales bacterium GAS188]|nr:hypothetical protein SAMN05519104_3434 [Rhizobiales bacterium GAS188]
MTDAIPCRMTVAGTKIRATRPGSATAPFAS